MIKIIHTADLHLDSPLSSLALRDEELQQRVQLASRDTLKTIVDLAIEIEVTAILICGDLFDRMQRSARTAAFLTMQFDRLKREGIQVFYIKGNHDAENPITNEAVFPDNIHIFTGHGSFVELEGTSVRIHGVSFSGRSAPESLVPKFKLPVPGMINIAMLHTSLAGSVGHDTYAPCSVNDLSAAGFDYWALGHIHKRSVHSESPWIVMPGTPQGRDIGESGPKSITLITIDDGQITAEEILTSSVEFAVANIDISNHEVIETLHKCIKERLHQQLDQIQTDNAILRVCFTGESNLSWQVLRDQEFLKEFVRETAAEIGRLWIDKVTFDVSAKSERDSPDATSELIEIMAELLESGQFSKEFNNDMDAVFKLLPTSVRVKLLDSSDAKTKLVMDISRRGGQRVAADMRGTTS